MAHRLYPEVIIETICQHDIPSHIKWLFFLLHCGYSVFGLFLQSVLLAARIAEEISSGGNQHRPKHLDRFVRKCDPGATEAKYEIAVRIQVRAADVVRHLFRVRIVLQLLQKPGRCCEGIIIRQEVPGPERNVLALLSPDWAAGSDHTSLPF